MLFVVAVSPVAGGWMVQTEALAAPLMFLSGDRAEEAAWRIKRALTSNGHWVEIAIKTRDGLGKSRFLCPSDEVMAIQEMVQQGHQPGATVRAPRAASRTQSAAQLPGDMMKPERAVFPRAPPAPTACRPTARPVEWGGGRRAAGAAKAKLLGDVLQSLKRILSRPTREGVTHRRRAHRNVHIKH